MHSLWGLPQLELLGRWLYFDNVRAKLCELIRGDAKEIMDSDKAAAAQDIITDMWREQTRVAVGKLKEHEEAEQDRRSASIVQSQHADGVRAGLEEYGVLKN